MTPRFTFSFLTRHIVAVVGLLVLCAGLSVTAAQPKVERSIFGRTPEGVEVEAYTLTNKHGATAKIITYGAIIADLRMPDRTGKLGPVVREMTATEQNFQKGFPQSAAIFGRVANRIAGAKFTLDGKEYRVTQNNGKNHIHGGKNNFSKVVWKAAPPRSGGTPAVELSYRAADGEEGFPGNLTTTVTYTLTDDNVLRIDYRATTDKPTPLNLTNHAYFNLAGSGDVLDLQLTIAADRYTVVDADLIPSGKIEPVRGTHLDFTTAQPLGARAAQLSASKRYDNNFVINRAKEGDTSLALAAKAHEPRSGRTMEVWTTEPGVQLYTSPLGPDTAGDRFGFFCLETQHYPDSVNHSHFPTTIVRPGKEFRSTTEFRFSAK